MAGRLSAGPSVATCHIAAAHQRCKNRLTLSAWLFSRDVSSEEAAFGFGVEETGSGVRAIVRLPTGIHAVKMLQEDGSVEYMICDERMEPLYGPAKTLDELRARFG